jgi:EAL domain-containing protein (putative c-di-GMP-specific phosphodiesterase class I)
MHKRSIAIVDDEPMFRSFAANVARSCGFEPYETASPAEFEDFVATRRPDVAMLELVMQESDGIALMCRLASRAVPMPFIIASRIDERILQTARRLGEARGLKIAGTLRKPLQASDLRALLARVADADAAPLAAALGEAIARDELTVHYQPCMDLRARRIVGVEALVRWQHPQRGIIAPAAFVPLAEDSGLIDGLTEVVLAKAIAQLARWRGDGLDLRCSVNFSARTLGNQALIERLCALCRAHDVDPAHLIVELTETATAHDLEQLREPLARLRACGFGVAIDDFGTGFSSLARLHQLPFSEIKLDRSFVAGMLHSRECRVIVKSTIDMAHDLGLRVVAEGVESAQLLHSLSLQGCDLAQGYGIARPLAAAQVPDFVTAHERKRVALA